jgi:class 3 adenylate cyclase
VKRTGEGLIAEFRSVVDAVRCRIEMQIGMVERNAGVPPERRIEFRMGVHLGDVVEESDGDLMGDGGEYRRPVGGRRQARRRLPIGRRLSPGEIAA